jgi:hypothetical protein
MDGVFLRRIELTAELRAPVFHLPMNDNAASPMVHDAAPGPARTRSSSTQRAT